MRAARLTLFLTLAACQGPAAPDPALCRDYLHRLCVAPICPQVEPLFPVGANCESTLQAKSGCGGDDFIFTAPTTRDRFLSCRLPLLRAGAGSEVHPSCEDVAESFAHCPDVLRLVQGIK